MRISSDKYHISFERYAFAAMSVYYKQFQIFLFVGTDKIPQQPQIIKIFDSEQEAKDAYSHIQNLLNDADEEERKNETFTVDVPGY